MDKEQALETIMIMRDYLSRIDNDLNTMGTEQDLEDALNFFRETTCATDQQHADFTAHIEYVIEVHTELRTQRDTLEECLENLIQEFR